MDKWELKDSSVNNLPMRAKGNLSYPQFIQLLRQLWSRAHPNIQLVTSGADDPAKYPCIIYSLQLRKAHQSEPKMRHREQRNSNGETFLIGGQRFQNLVYFEAIGESKDVDTVESLVEVFEDFMMEYTPVFKKLGVSELVYARRLSDSELARPGQNVVRRIVSYMVTTEKVIATRYDKLEKITVNARTSFQNLNELYSAGTIYDSSPRYHLVGPDAHLTYILTQEAIDNAADFDDLLFIIPRTNFRIGDTLFLARFDEDQATWDATPAFWGDDPIYLGHDSYQGFFQVTNLVGNVYSSDVGYTLTRRSGVNPDLTNIGPGRGTVFFLPQTVDATVVDEFKSNPEE